MVLFPLKELRGGFEGHVLSSGHAGDKGGRPRFLIRVQKPHRRPILPARRRRRRVPLPLPQHLLVRDRRRIELDQQRLGVIPDGPIRDRRGVHVARGQRDPAGVAHVAPHHAPQPPIGGLRVPESAAGDDGELVAAGGGAVEGELGAQHVRGIAGEGRRHQRLDQRRGGRGRRRDDGVGGFARSGGAFVGARRVGIIDVGVPPDATDLFQKRHRLVVRRGRRGGGHASRCGGGGLFCREQRGRDEREAWAGRR